MKTLTITSPDGKSTATFIPEKGGLATSLKMPDPARPGETRELLYLPQSVNLEAFNKIGVAWPFCFPICGRLTRAGQSAYLHQHHLYKMDIHGFAHAEPWQVINHSKSGITLRLTASERSRKQYPFEFEVILAYRLDNSELHCDQTYRNLGSTLMPYYAGFHPYFWIDPSRYRKSEVMLHCKPIQNLQYNADLTDILGEKPLHSFPKAIDAPEINENLLVLGEDHHASLHFPDHSVITMSVQGSEDLSLFSYLQLYHIPNEPFFCIEPWMGHPNALNTVNAARILAPGQSDLATLMVRLHRSS